MPSARSGTAVKECGAHHLLRCHADSFNAELAAAHVKEVFEVGSKKVDNKDIVQTLLTEVVNLGDTRCDGRKNLVHAQCATLYPDS